MKKSLLTLIMAIFATTAFAQLNYSDVFPADFSKGLPNGWGLGQDAISESVDGGLKITGTLQSDGYYRADLKYNMYGDNNNNSAVYFNFDASKYKVFAVRFIGERPTTGNLKLQNISLDGSWINNDAKYGLKTGNNAYTGDLTDSDGNHTYYWVLGGTDWTGNHIINRIEMVIANIKDANQKSYIVSEINWYESEEALKSTIETKSVVENKTTSVKYPTFLEAYNAAATGEILSVLTDIRIDDRIAMKSITIEGATGTEKIIQNFNNKLLFNTGSNSNMTFKNIVFESTSGPGNQPMFEHNANSKNSHILTFDNVTINGITSSNGNGLFNIKQGCLALNNVNFNNCSATGLAGFVNIKDTNSLSLSGANEGLKVYVSAYNSIFANELSNTTPIELTLDATLLSVAADESVTRADEVTNAIVTGCDDPNKFHVTNVGYKLEADGNGNLVLAEDTSNGINGIEVDNSDAPVEYYNLQGVKVANPEKGIYIMRQGSSVRKVIL